MSTDDWIPASPRNRCPVCGAKSWCEVSREGTTAHCMKVQSDRAASSRMGGWLHRLESGTTPYILPVARPATTILPLDVKQHDQIARDMIRNLHLQDEHRANLLARGMTDEQIARREYRSITRHDRSHLVGTLRALYSRETLLRFPGMVETDGRYGPYLRLLAKDGILIPVRNVEGLICAFRVRVDRPGTGGKYRYLSSKVDGVGLSPGTPVHVARPLELVDNTTVWITEGELKADIAADRLGRVVLSIPGVSAIRDLLPTLAAMEAA